MNANAVNATVRQNHLVHFIHCRLFFAQKFYVKFTGGFSITGIYFMAQNIYANWQHSLFTGIPAGSHDENHHVTDNVHHACHVSILVWFTIWLAHRHWGSGLWSLEIQIGYDSTDKIIIYTIILKMALWIVCWCYGLIIFIINNYKQ